MVTGIAIGMSGGVDSSVSAARLYEKGYNTCGVTLCLTDDFRTPECADCKSASCGTASDSEQAAELCRSIGFNHVSIDAREDFFNKVIKPFAAEYERGRTPNPCILCNKFIKFPVLLEYADKIGYSHVATGHYANVSYDEQSGRYLLKKAVNTQKDQTYVLYSLTQETLSRVIFPLGNVMKSEVKTYASNNGFVSANRPESQDICFVKDGDYAGFLRDSLDIQSQEGNFLDKAGKVLGTHKGIVNYTIGQRRGLGISSDEPYYVVRKDFENNAVILGRNEDLYCDSLTASEVNYISIATLERNMRVTVKTRYTQNESAAEIAKNSDGTVAVKFDSPQRAITPGQAVVFYDGDVVVGGGTIM